MVLRILISLDCYYIATSRIMLHSIGREGGKYRNAKGNDLLDVLIADASTARATYTQHHAPSRPFAFVFSLDSSPGELSCHSTDHPHNLPTSCLKEQLEGLEVHAIVFRNVRWYNFTLTNNPFSLVSSQGQVDFPIFGPVVTSSGFLHAMPVTSYGYLSGHSTFKFIL